MMKFLSMIDLSTLKSDFKAIIDSVMSDLNAQSFNMVPYFGVRNIDQQNKLYRAGRSTGEINAKIQELRASNAANLAASLNNVGPQSGSKIVTNAYGGVSWHNWGYAVDFYWMQESGSISWNGAGDGYQALGKVAQAHGLTWGGAFKSLPDWGHVQMYPKEPLDLYTITEIDAHFYPAS